MMMVETPDACTLLLSKMRADHMRARDYVPHRSLQIDRKIHA